MPIPKGDLATDCSNSYITLREDYDPNDPGSLPNLVACTKVYLETIKEHIETYVSGLHEPTKRHPHHFHTHIVLNKPLELALKDKYLSNAYYYYPKLLKEQGLYNSNVETRNARSISKPKHIILLPGLTLQDSIHQFLRYPLKDKNPLAELCDDKYDISQLNNMAHTASEHNQFAKEQTAKAQAKDELKVTKWNAIKDHLSQFPHPMEPQTIFRQIVLFTRTDNPPPSLSTIKTNTEKYYLLTCNEAQLKHLAKKHTNHLETPDNDLPPSLANLVKRELAIGAQKFS
jgi:hypothetical protein